MSTFGLSPWDQFFYDFNTVSMFILTQFRRIFQSLYGNKSYNYLLYAALIPVVLMICTDIIFSFVLSVRAKELRYFNCLSSRSWQSLRVNNGSVARNRLSPLSGNMINQARDLNLKSIRLNDLSLRLTRYKNVKAGDVIRCSDGSRFVYVGLRLDAKNKPLYAYRSTSGVYYSTFNPRKWANSNGSTRKLSIAKSVKK